MYGSLDRRYGWFLFLLGAAMCLLLLAGCGNDEDATEIGEVQGNSADTIENRVDSGDTSATDSIPSPQTWMPDASFVDIEGVAFNLSEYRGSVVMVDLWQTKTKVCLDRLEDLKSIRQEFYPEGFEIIAIAMDRVSKEGLRRFVDRHKLPYPVIQGAFTYNLDPSLMNSLPISYFYERDGMLAGHTIGPRDKEFYRQVIRKLLDTE